MKMMPINNENYFLHRMCVLCLEEGGFNIGDYVHCCIPKKKYRLPIVCEFHNVCLQGLTKDVKSGEHHVGYCEMNRVNRQMLRTLMKYHKTGEQHVTEFHESEGN